MIPTIIFFVSLAFLALLGTLVFMLLDVIREGPESLPCTDRRWRWRPPVASGSKLMLWGAEVAEAVAQKLLLQRRTKTTPTKLADEVLTGTSFAIQHLPLMSVDANEGDCRDRKFHRIGVTPPEVLAIADKIRPHSQEAKRIHDIAEYNAWRLSKPALNEKGAAPLVCPLRTSDDTCAAGDLCPLHCRATCHLTGAVMPDNARVLEEVARDLGFGVEVGLSRALEAGGVDGHVYELNSALAVALETPNASRRWAKGEDVLADCMRDDYSAYAE